MSRWQLIHSLVRLLICAYALLSQAVSAEQAARTAICCDTRAGNCAAPSYGNGRVALIIGTDDYSHYSPILDSLKNAKNDAESIARALHDQGVSVQCLLDPTRDLVVSEINSLAAHLFRKQDQGIPSRDAHALLYFAGHGFNDQGTDYLIFGTKSALAGVPNVDNILVDSGYAVPGILRTFNGLRSYLITAIFDACRGLVRTNSVQEPPRFRGSAFANPNDQLQQDNHQTQKLVVYSTFQHGLSLDTAPPELQGNGLFAAHLKYFIGLRDIPLYSIFSATGLFVSHDAQKMKQLQQPNLLDIGGLRASRPWRESKPRNTCNLVASQLWNTAFGCLSPLGNQACAAELCDTWKELASVSEPVPAERECIQAATRRLPYKLPDVCKIIPQPAAAYRAPIRVQTPFGAAQLALETFVQAQAQVTPIELKNHLDAALVEAESIAAKKELANQLRPVWLSPIPQQSSLTPGLSAITSQTVELKTLPNEKASTVAVLPSDLRIHIDCVSMKCREGWAGIRTGTATQIRGYIQTSTLRPTEDNATFGVEFEDEAIALSEGMLEKLTAQVSRNGPATAVNAVVAVRKMTNASNEEFLLAIARRNQIRSILLRSGIQPDRILDRIVETSDETERSSAIISLSRNRPSLDVSLPRRPTSITVSRPPPSGVRRDF